MRPLKIMHVTTIDLTARCFLRPLFKMLTEQGHKVILACTVEKFRDEIEATGAEVIHLPISRRISPVKDIASFLDLIYLIRRVKPDIVHSHTSKAGFLTRIAARLCGVPLVIHTIHELPENSTSSLLIKKFYRALEFIAARFAHHHITVSMPNYDQIIAEGICKPKGLTLIREGLNLEKYKASKTPAQVREEFGIPENDPLIVSVGRLEPAKGHDDLLKAFSYVVREFPDAKLIIVGTGHLYDVLQKRISILGIDGKAILAGWREDMLDILGAADVFALASLYEGLGIATMEAMAMSRPVVCSGVGGVTDVVVDGETGFLTPAHAPEIMAEKICILLGDKEKAASFAASARNRVETVFREDKLTQDIIDLYMKLAEGRIF